MSEDPAMKLPIGADFLALVRQQEDAADEWSAKALPGFGVKAPALVDQLGTVLAYLDGLGSCLWGCPKGPHTVQYILGASESTARAALRLAFMAFYDEALTLSRSVAERANLLYLFARDAGALSEFETGDDKYRRQKFSAVRVRLRLEEAGHDAPFGEDHYRKLSQFGVHPGRPPQQFLPGQPPVIVSLPNPVALVACLNELGQAGILALGLGAVLLPEESHVPLDEIRVAVRGDNVGGIDVLSLDSLGEVSAREDPGASEGTEPPQT